MNTAPLTAPITDANPSVEAMEARVARFQRLVPTADYADSAIPGCERTTWRVIGEQPGAPIAAEHFHLNLVRWEVFWGPADERKLVLEPLDTVSIPPGVSRGFRNIAAEPSLLIGIAGGHDPGHINWPQQVRAAALAVGVSLP